MRRDRIGLFDSGLGGLTVMRKIRETLPHESIVFFGDTARLPYGSKSPETIARYTIESTIFLMEQNIKVLVIACNTAASAAADRLRKIFNIPILDVISPGAERACEVTKNGRIAVLGTKATIQSGAYERAIKERLPEACVTALACPLFVPLVEEKFLYHPATRLIVQEYLKPLKTAGIDTLLLGCTHYPVLATLIQEELGPEVHIVDSASTTAYQLKELLKKEKGEGEKEGQQEGECQFFVSDDPEKFKILGADFLGAPIPHCELFNLETTAK